MSLYSCLFTTSTKDDTEVAPTNLSRHKSQPRKRPKVISLDEARDIVMQARPHLRSVTATKICHQWKSHVAGFGLTQVIGRSAVVRYMTKTVKDPEHAQKLFDRFSKRSNTVDFRTFAKMSCVWELPTSEESIMIQFMVFDMRSTGTISQADCSRCMIFGMDPRLRQVLAQRKSMTLPQFQRECKQNHLHKITNFAFGPLTYVDLGNGSGDPMTENHPLASNFSQAVAELAPNLVVRSGDAVFRGSENVNLEEPISVAIPYATLVGEVHENLPIAQAIHGE